MLRTFLKLFLVITVICLHFSSTKFAFAKNFDINKDGIIDSEDLYMISQYIGTENENYDLNNDGIVDSIDISILAKHISSKDIIDNENTFIVYKDNLILGSFPKNNLIDAISLASQNHGIVKQNDKIIWNNENYFIYSGNSLIGKSPTIRDAFKTAKDIENSIVFSKNGNIIYDKSLNYRKIIGVTRTSVNLRNEPNVSSRTDLTIPNGTLVEVESIVNGFYKILYYDQKNQLNIGFIPNYIDIIQDDINNSQLGYISAREESNGDPGAIGLNPNDKGGASFGVWQLSSKMGTVDDFLDFIKDKDKEIYLQLSEAKNQDNNSYSENFISTWKEIAKNKHDSFYELQRLFIKRNYYDSFIKLAKKNNLNINYLLDYNSTSNMIWSTCVQHGASGAIKILKKITPTTTMENLIEKIYEERLNIIAKSYPPNSTNPGIVSLYNGVKNRLENEKKEILRIYQRELSY
mgnify:FL=1